MQTVNGPVQHDFYVPFLRVELDPESDQHVRCDRCGIGVDAVDGWTNDILVFCGGVYGNGCDVVYLASEDAVVNGDAVVVAS